MNRYSLSLLAAACLLILSGPSFACEAVRNGDAVEYIGCNSDAERTVAEGVLNGKDVVGDASGNNEPNPEQVKIDNFKNDGPLGVRLLSRLGNIQNLPPDQQRKELESIRLSVGGFKDEDAAKSFMIQFRVRLDEVKAKWANAPPNEQPIVQPDKPQGQGLQIVADALPQHLIQLAPNMPEGWSYSGQNKVEKKDYQGGFDDLTHALDLGANDANTYASYSAAAFNLGDMGLAAEAAAAALKLDPNHRGAQAIYKLSVGRAPKVNLPSSLGGRNASGLEQAGQFDPGAAGGAGVNEGPGRRLTAAQVAAEIQKQVSAPASPVQKSAGLTRSAGSSLAVKDYTSAHALASKAIEFNEKNAQAWTYRAIANNKMRRYADSVSDASSALGYAPGSAAALQTRSNSFSRMRKFNEGLADANRTLEAQPRNGQAYFNRAYALAGLGERAEALESLRQAAEADPRFRPRYEEAVQAPSEADLLFLFDDKPAAAVVRAAPVSPAAKKKRFLRLMLTTVMGGILVALGLLHILSASWREKVRNTIRRVLSESPEAGAAARTAAPGETPAARPPANGFWGQYTLSREIGAGGMGIVYEARDNSLDRRVAVKKMRDEIRVDPQERRRFINEARTVASLHHPHIVDIYAIVEEESDVYLVFEYVDGTTLSDLIGAKGFVPFEESRRILKSVCAAVDCAHRQNVIHRDLKPSNIMLTGDGIVKVMDFGVARQAKDAMTKMSMTNTIVGTPPYMAPEQEQGTVRKESDVFALGICFYELLTGKLPFSGQGAGMLLNKINGKHAPASSVRPELSPELDAVLAKALCPDPDKRYRTPAEFMAAVEALSPVAAG